MAAGFPITTKSDVKNIIGPNTTHDTDDDFLDDLIGEVSDLAELVMGRLVLSTSRTETYDIRPRMRRLMVKAWPISSITEIKAEAEGDFSTVDALDSDTYRFDADTGTVWFDVIPHPVNNRSTFFKALQIQYTGGMAADTAAFKAAFPAVANAAARQVAYAWSRRQSLGAGSVTGQGRGSRGSNNDYGLLDSTYKIFQQHGRVAVG